MQDWWDQTCRQEGDSGDGDIAGALPPNAETYHPHPPPHPHWLHTLPHALSFHCLAHVTGTPPQFYHVHTSVVCLCTSPFTHKHISPFRDYKPAGWTVSLPSYACLMSRNICLWSFRSTRHSLYLKPRLSCAGSTDRGSRVPGTSNHAWCWLILAVWERTRVGAWRLGRDKTHCAAYCSSGPPSPPIQVLHPRKKKS